MYGKQHLIATPAPRDPAVDFYLVYLKKITFGKMYNSMKHLKARSWSDVGWLYKSKGWFVRLVVKVCAAEYFGWNSDYFEVVVQ